MPVIRRGREVPVEPYARLVAITAEGPGLVYTLSKPIVHLGRADDNDIIVRNPFVSRHHAELRWDAQGWYNLHDLGSRNGTRLNGQRVREPERLFSGDTLTICGLSYAYQTGEDTLAFAPTSRSGVVIDAERAEVWIRDRRVELTAKELRMLCLLQSKSGAICGKDEIATHVWPEQEGSVSDESIEQLVSRLRRKLGDNPDHPRYLLTVRGVGYRLDQE